MAATILDGKALAQARRAQIQEEVARFRAETGIPPGLAVVLVGDDPASRIYVRNKERACQAVGIASEQHHLPSSTSQAQLLSLIDRLNRDPRIHGILVQLPCRPTSMSGPSLRPSTRPRTWTASTRPTWPAWC